MFIRQSLNLRYRHPIGARIVSSLDSYCNDGRKDRPLGRLDVSFKKRKFSRACGANPATKKQWTVVRHDFTSRNIWTSKRCPKSSDVECEEELLSPEEVEHTVRRNESKTLVRCGVIKSCHANQIGSNQPVEDRMFAVKCLHKDDSFVFGVLDGHGGNACAHNVCQRLPEYLAVSLAPAEKLSNMDLDNPPSFIRNLQTPIDYSEMYCYHKDLLCRENFKKFFQEQWTLKREYMLHMKSVVSKAIDPIRNLFVKSADNEGSDSTEKDVVQSIKNTFVQLDRDLCNEALPQGLGSEQYVSKQAVLSAASGACALVAYVTGTDLYIANSGDCRAVIGVENDDRSWSAVQVSKDHTAGNPHEVERIHMQHPESEANTCIRHGRLLGRLAPLRAFGDVQFKWDMDTQRNVLSVVTAGRVIALPHFFTPPYLTAEAEVLSHQIQSNDKFMVLATDGLWDMLSNEEVVHLVVDYVRNKNAKGKKKHDPGKPRPPTKNNAATFLMRHALGGDDYESLTSMLSIPYPDVRMYRDDMTVLVVFFKNYMNQSDM